MESTDTVIVALTIDTLELLSIIPETQKHTPDGWVVSWECKFKKCFFFLFNEILIPSREISGLKRRKKKTIPFFFYKKLISLEFRRVSFGFFLKL